MGKTLIDEKSLTQNIGQKSLNLPPQYNARRQALKNLEKEFKALLTKRQNGTITKKELGRFRNLPREIKAVTITDPEVLFKRNRQGKWTYTKEEAWKLKGKANAPGLKPPETHHKAGLDKYYGKIKGWDDDVLFNLHESLASKGKYLGNHPKNRVNLDSSLHVGRARQFTPAYESIHGAIDYSDLTDAEWETLVDKVSSENIDYIKTDNLDFDFDSDIGSPGDPKVGRRPRTPIPSDEAFDYATSENFERLESMLDNDYQLADAFSKKAPNTKIAWEGKTASSRVTNFIKNNKTNEAFWPEDTLDALKNQDLDRLVAIEKELPLIKEAAMQDALKSGKTLQQWQDVRRGSRALFSSPATKVAAVGIGFGLWDAFSGTQEAISGTHDYLNPKEETSDLERTADGLKAFSGALTAASPLVGATAIPAVGAKLSELHLRNRALKAETRYDTIHDRTSTPTDLWIKKTMPQDAVRSLELK